MARQYSAKTFLRNTPNDLLQQYFDERGIHLGFQWIMLDETEVNPIFVGMEQLPADVRSQVDADFAMINDLACEAGVLAILEQASACEHDLSDRFSGMRNAYERAFWTFLRHPIHFRVAGNFHEMDRRAGWRRRFVGVRLDAATDDESLREMAEALRLFYRRQGRGRFCHVDVYVRCGPDRYCYFAYPEDYAGTELGFDEHGRFQQRARRSAFEVIFVYRPEEGMLDLRVRGGASDTRELETAFVRTILGLRDLPEDGRLPYDLTVLKRREFAFPTDPADRIAAVDVRAMRFDLPGIEGNRMVLQLGPRESRPKALHVLIDQALDRARMPLSALHISQARLRLAFAPLGSQRPKTLTFGVTYPDRCTLGDDPHDQIAKKYLRRWGIAHA